MMQKQAVFKKFISGLKDDFLDMLYPADLTCMICDAELDESAVNGFCYDCYAELPFNNGKVCLRCGAANASLADFCNRCQSIPFAFDKACSSFIYEGELPKLVKSFKFGGRKYLSDNLAAFMAETLKDAAFAYDIAIPVPLHKKTFKKRGFNQAEELCKSVLKITGNSAAMRSDIFVKIKYTGEQARLDSRTRAANLADAFSVLDKSVLKNKTVLLVDDVLTTGATAHECAKTLKKNGASTVFVLTLASTHFKPNK